MRLLRHLTVVLLLIFWVAAKEHCNLEAAGLLPDTCVTDCGEMAGEDDGCVVVERAQFKSATDHPKVPPPQIRLVRIAAIVLASQPETKPTVLIERAAEPEARRRTWQFIERAAPPTRAPATVV